MLLRTYWPVCFALCAIGCVGQADFSGSDAGVGTGGLTSVGGTSALGDSQARGGAESMDGVASAGGGSSSGGTSHSGGATTFVITAPGPYGGFSGRGDTLNNSGGDSTFSGSSSGGISQGASTQSIAIAPSQVTSGCRSVACPTLFNAPRQSPLPHSRG
jgi:hypothetical protein